MKTIKLLAIALAAFALYACEQATSPPSAVSFATDVKPVLQAKCLSCHDVASEGVAASGLNLSDYDGVMAGTKFGPVVVAGSSDSSALYLTVARKTAPEIQLPPQHRDALAEGRGVALTDAEIATFRDWIDQGAANN